jgi:RimJ/RimL family protein N-acetyltransferase
MSSLNRSIPAVNFDLQPNLRAELIELRPLRADDWNSLFEVASDPLIWEQHPSSDRFKEEVFREFFREAMDSKGALLVLDRKSQNTIGSSRYFGLDSRKSEIEIGWTFLARSYWGGKYNGELKRLMLEHAFKYVDSVIFKIGATNFRSQKAIEKIGGVMIERREKPNPEGNLVEHVYQIKRQGTELI